MPTKHETVEQLAEIFVHQMNFGGTYQGKERAAKKAEIAKRMREAVRRELQGSLFEQGGGP